MFEFGNPSVRKRCKPRLPVSWHTDMQMLDFERELLLDLDEVGSMVNKRPRITS